MEECYLWKRCRLKPATLLKVTFMCFRLLPHVQMGLTRTLNNVSIQRSLLNISTAQYIYSTVNILLYIVQYS